MRLYTIPAGTEESRCPRGCGATVYWIESKRAGGKGIVRLPVDTSGTEGSTPDSWSEGKGRNHFEVCTA